HCDGSHIKPPGWRFGWRETYLIFDIQGDLLISPEVGHPLFGYSLGSLSIDFLVVKFFFLENTLLNKKVYNGFIGRYTISKSLFSWIAFVYDIGNSEMRSHPGTSIPLFFREEEGAIIRF
ncbi:MAG: hypothetical protein MUO43_07260, partial [Desulfobacterales bacterium]|nr:hypothetical protein [Desulfobacterales bacterium]